MPLFRGDAWALHPGTRPHEAESDRRAPAPAPTPGQAVCLVLSIKMHPNQALYAECRVVHSSSQDQRQQKHRARELQASSATLAATVREATQQEYCGQAEAEAAAAQL